MLGYIDRVAVVLLQNSSLLLRGKRVGLLVGLNVILPVMLSGRLVLVMMLLLIEHALELRLFDWCLSHKRLTIGRCRPLLKELSTVTLEVGVALRGGRIVAVVGRKAIRFCLPVVLTVLGRLVLIHLLL